MGQCPFYIPSEETSSESNKDEKDVVPSMCIPVDVCSVQSVTNITLAKYDEHRFLVRHEYDEANLIDIQQVEKIYEREKLEYIRQKNKVVTDENIDDSKTDITTGTKYSKAGTDVTLNSIAGTDVHSVITSKVCNADKYKSSSPPTPRDTQAKKEGLLDAKSLLQKRHEQIKKDEMNQKLEDSLCGVNCTDPFAEDIMFNEGNALHLRMKANLINFYRTKYLELFPDTPLPIGMTNTTHSVKCHSPKGPMESIEEPVPQLAPVGSHDSSQSNERSSDSSNSSNDNETCVRLERDGSSFLNLAVQGSLGLLDRRQSSFQNITSSTLNSNQLVVLNRVTGEVVAVCVLKALYGPPVVRIYAMKPRISGQSPSTDVFYKEETLYSWAEFTVEGEFPLPVRYSIAMSLGDDKYEKEARYRGSHMDVGVPNIKIVGRDEDGHNYSGCALLSLRTNEVGDQTNFSLIISKGVDPALFICLTAIADEVLESTMRTQYYHKQKKIRKSKKHSSKQ